MNGLNAQLIVGVGLLTVYLTYGKINVRILAIELRIVLMIDAIDAGFNRLPPCLEFERF